MFSISESSCPTATRYVPHMDVISTNRCPETRYIIPAAHTIIASIIKNAAGMKSSNFNANMRMLPMNNATYINFFERRFTSSTASKSLYFNRISPFALEVKPLETVKYSPLMFKQSDNSLICEFLTILTSFLLMNFILTVTKT